MLKLINIFIVSSVLTASALLNVTVYKCVHDGDLCMTKSCCPAEEAGETCCSEKDTADVLIKDVCCEEIKIVQDTVFNDVNLNKAKSPDSSKIFADFITLSLVEKDIIFQDDIRGPPRWTSTFSKYDTPTYILNCSLLC